MMCSDAGHKKTEWTAGGAKMLPDRFPFVSVVALIACVMAFVCAPPIAYPQETPVHFTDPALKAAIEEELGVTDPTPTEMMELRRLTAREKGIADLD